MKINGEMYYLWRAVDFEGEVLEIFATKRRDRRAALKFLKRAMKRYGRPGTNVVIDPEGIGFQNHTRDDSFALDQAANNTIESR